jgi:hypothetical protein
MRDFSFEMPDRLAAGPAAPPIGGLRSPGRHGDCRSACALLVGKT